MSNRNVALGTAGLVALAGLALYGLGGRMARHVAETRIQAPPERVFAFLHEPDAIRRWAAGFVESVPESDAPIGVGSRSTDVFEEDGRRIEMHTEIVAFEPGRRLEVEIENPFARVRSRYDLEPAAGGTRVRLTMEARYRGFFRLLAPFLRAKVQARQEADLERLREAVENGAEPAG